MAYVFIGGIPASGKSFLAKEIASETGSFYSGIDTLRSEMTKDPTLKKWVNFFEDLNEEEYYQNASCAVQWENLVNQSEAFWPTILDHVKKIQAEHPSAIFEGVNLLPQLTIRDLDFQGVFLLGESVEQIFARNKESPRWGATEELQKIEAENFFNCEGKMYDSEAKKYGYKSFRNSQDAKTEILKLISRR